MLSGPCVAVFNTVDLVGAYDDVSVGFSGILPVVAKLDLVVTAGVLGQGCVFVVNVDARAVVTSGFPVVISPSVTDSFV